MRITRATIALSTIAFAAAILTGCGSSSGSDASTSSTTGSSYKVVPAAVVTTGLGEVRAIAQGLAAARAESETKGRAELDRMYTKWFTFEGTVRKNDKNLYLEMEDGLGGMKIGVQGNRPDRITRGLADFESAVDAYLKAFP